MKLTNEMLKGLKAVYKKYGRVSATWIQYKYHVSYEQATKALITFEKKITKCL
jgi:hypothetical protein